MGASSKFLREQLAEFAIALEIPLAAHRLPAGAQPLDVQQHPSSPARGSGAAAGVVLSETPLDVGGPADIGQIPVFGAAPEDIDEAWHAPIVRDSWQRVASGGFSSLALSPTFLRSLR